MDVGGCLGFDITTMTTLYLMHEGRESDDKICHVTAWPMGLRGQWLTRARDCIMKVLYNDCVMVLRLSIIVLSPRFASCYWKSMDRKPINYSSVRDWVVAPTWLRTLSRCQLPGRKDVQVSGGTFLDYWCRILTSCTSSADDRCQSISYLGLFGIKPRQ